MGQSGGYLTFTNSSSTDCTLTGWPRVTGTQSGSTVTAGHASSTMFGAWILSQPIPVTTLGPQQSAYAVVAGGNTPVGKATSCPSVTRLNVSLPGSPAISTISALIYPGHYLPDCATITGTPSIVVSDIVPLTDLAHGT
jgi:hypothetical protein